MSCLACAVDDVITNEPSDPLLIRIVAVNDVYSLENFSNYATARKVESEGPALTIGTLAGDFLAPSLLSTIDSGVGAVACMNASGIDFVCIGNHENDVKLSEMHKRMKESNFTWINSNMLNLPLGEGMAQLPRFVIVKAESKGIKRRIAFIGLNTEDPKCVPPGRFGNCSIDPLNDTARRLYDELKKNHEVDIVIPLTHQLIAEDRILAEMKIGFPVIIGGHDHTLYNEVIEGCHVVKFGQNIENIGIIDLIWNSPNQLTPTVTVTVKDPLDYPKDPEVEAVFRKHNYVVEQMSKATLFGLPPGEILSSKGVREKPSNLATFLLTLVKRIMDADCALLPGGSIRADADYAGKDVFTYADLSAEFPFPTPLIVLPLPGSVIIDTIAFTRAHSLKSPPEPKAFFMQADDGVKWYAPNNSVISINGQMVDPDKTYNTVLNYFHALKGLDKIEPLVNYCESQKKHKNPIFMKDEDTTIELKHLLVGHFSKLVLFNMISDATTFKSMDENNDGIISKEEFRKAALVHHGGDVSDILVDNLFNIADEDGNGQIDAYEIRELLNQASSYYAPASPLTQIIDSWTGFFTGLFGGVESAIVVKETRGIFKTLSKDSTQFSLETEASASKKVKVIPASS